MSVNFNLCLTQERAGLRILMNSGEKRKGRSKRLSHQLQFSCHTQRVILSCAEYCLMDLPSQRTER